MDEMRAGSASRSGQGWMETGNVCFCSSEEQEDEQEPGCVALSRKNSETRSVAEKHAER